MSENPHRRLVSKGRYVWLITGRATLVFVLILVSLSLAIFILEFLGTVIGGFFGARGTSHAGSAVIFALGIGACCFLVSRIIKKEEKIERVIPITRRTTSSLPPEQTLVRASTLAPSQQEAELLRAAQYGKDIPAEELLRAAQKISNNV